MTAMIEIVAMNTGLGLEDCRFLCEKYARLSQVELGLADTPAESPLPLEVRYRWLTTAFALLSDELRRRGVPEENIANLAHDVDTFYRGVRGAPPK